MLKKFITTSRYDKPHGIFLLYYPCIWGITLNNINISEVFFLSIIFFFGAAGMRAAGCIWNDFNDKKFDVKVKRTKSRDIASGNTKKNEIILFIIINLLIGTIPLYFLPFKSFILCLFVIPLIITYPFMKRLTWWPQLWLGINYNWGIIIGNSSVSENIFVFEMILFYLGCIFWTIAYDTVYGFQDIEDDLKIGVKSTSIKFKKKPKMFLTTMYIVSLTFWTLSLFLLQKSFFNITFIMFLFFVILCNLFFLKIDNVKSCYSFFIKNSYFGLFVTLTLISI